MLRIAAALLDEIAYIVGKHQARKWCQLHGHRELHGAWPPMCGTCHRLILEV